MKVFISWSGELSRDLAEAVADWMPRVVQAADPFISTRDIAKGDRHFPVIGHQLGEAHFGIFCLTPDNVEAPWIHFEAGAIGKMPEGSRVCCLLFDLRQSNVVGPLANFQHTVFEREDIMQLVHSMNEAMGERGVKKPEVLCDAFDGQWGRLETKVKEILDKHDTQQAPRREVADMTEEILERVRQMGRAAGGGVDLANLNLAMTVVEKGLSDIRAAGRAIGDSSQPVKMGAIRRALVNLERRLRSLGSLIGRMDTALRQGENDSDDDIEPFPHRPAESGDDSEEDAV